MHSTQLIKSLKIHLKSRGIRYNEIASKLAVSEITVKRWFSKKAFSLERFIQIADLYGIQLSALEHTSSENTREYEYTLEQEIALSKDLGLLAFFDLLIRHGHLPTVRKELQLSKAETSKKLLQLDRLNLIELAPGEKIRFHKGRSVRWRKNGPLRKTLFHLAKNEFLNSNFNEKDQTFQFLLLDVSPDGLQKIDLMAKEFLKKARFESELDEALKKPRKRIGLLLASRPWNFSSLRGQSQT